MSSILKDNQLETYLYTYKLTPDAHNAYFHNDTSTKHYSCNIKHNSVAEKVECVHLRVNTHTHSHTHSYGLLKLKLRLQCLAKGHFDI